MWTFVTCGILICGIKYFSSTLSNLVKDHLPVLHNLECACIRKYILYKYMFVYITQMYISSFIVSFDLDLLWEDGPEREAFWQVCGYSPGPDWMPRWWSFPWWKRGTALCAFKLYRGRFWMLYVLFHQTAVRNNQPSWSICMVSWKGTSGHWDWAMTELSGKEWWWGVDFLIWIWMVFCYWTSVLFLGCP